MVFNFLDIVKARLKAEKRSETIYFPESPFLSRNGMLIIEFNYVERKFDYSPVEYRCNISKRCNIWK